MHDVVIHGAAVGLQTLGMEFDPSYPYTGCKLCGKVFQSDLDRDPMYGLPADMIVRRRFEAMMRRKRWSHNHASTHSEAEHLQLAKSGAWCTPEAAHKLAAYGVVSLIDLVVNDEIRSALAESKAIPVEDVEG